MLRLVNPVALTARPVQELFVRAFDDDRFADVKEVMGSLVGDLGGDEIAVFIARSVEGELIGLSIVSSETGLWSDVPSIVHFYCAGGRSTALRLVEASREWLIGKGARSLRVINQTRRSDEAHMLFFSPLGGEHRVIGSVIEYEFPVEGSP